jgi:DNA-binding transcriptional LysR family regulator
VYPAPKFATPTVARAGRDFENEPFISLGRTYRMRHLVDALFDSEEVSRRMEIETQNAFVACELAALGEGITIVDTITAARFGDRVALVPVSPSAPADALGEIATIHRNHR